MKAAVAGAKPARAQKNAARTAALLAAAAETFAERGFQAATMEQIADRVGLTKGALYYRYRTKEDLFLALLDERCARYTAELERTPVAGWGAFAEQFLAVVRDGTWPRLYFEFVSYAARHPQARRRMVKRLRALRAALQRVIEAQAAQAGVEPAVPAAQIALALTAVANGLALERLADPRSVPDRAFFELPALILANGAGGRTAA
ncbi:MAG TPA: TetR/AcrR family transcriptional regulator [Thermoleophilaceae bacterium]